MKPRLLRPWRRAVQWTGLLIYLLLPWLRVAGESLLRFDLPAGRLYFGGIVLGLDEFYLAGLVLLGLLFLFLLLTLVVGRFWCGWFCPQTWLAELVEGVACGLGLRVNPQKIEGSRSRLALLHLIALALALILAAALVWYFIEPRLYWQRLLTGTLGPWPLGSTLVLAALIYADLLFIRRLACREFCPYGRFQAILLDAGTLTLRLPPEATAGCFDCQACVRACPMGIDIRQGYQVECINCGTCLDACRKVMARRRQPGLIRYTFGVGGRGWRALFTPRLLLLSLLLLLIWTAFFYLVGQRTELSLQVSRIVGAAPRLTAEGGEVVLFTVRAGSRGGRPTLYRLRAESAAGQTLTLLGPGAEPAWFEPGQRRRLDVALVLPPDLAGDRIKIIFTMVDAQGGEQARRRIELAR